MLISKMEWRAQKEKQLLRSFVENILFFSVVPLFVPRYVIEMGFCSCYIFLKLTVLTQSLKGGLMELKGLLLSAEYRGLGQTGRKRAMH